jgi:hypothetical protein
MPRLPAIAALMLLIAAPSNAADRLLAAKGHWAAFRDSSGACRAVSRAERIAPRGQAQAVVSVRFDRAGRRWGELGFRLSRPARPGSSVILTIGGQPFQLAGSSGLAWSRGAQQEAAIIAAIRTAPSMRLSARSASGRAFADRYLLDGAPTAIDAAAAACSR